MKSSKDFMEQRKDESRKQYLKRLNSTAFRCAECRQAFLDKDACAPGFSICKSCGKYNRSEEM